jgi:hypothetical protein
MEGISERCGFALFGKCEREERCRESCSWKGNDFIDSEGYKEYGYGRIEEE